MHRIIPVILLLVAAIAAPSPTALASGQTILTVTGAIDKPNRGPADDFMDAFFASQDVGFEAAARFDLAALEALGMQKITVSYEDWPAPLTFEGPLLSDVLAAAGATGEVMLVRALDGYAPEIPVSDTRDFPVVLALKVNGEYLGLGDRGPSWVVYPRDDYPALAETDDAKYVWSVYHIEVK